RTVRHAARRPHARLPAECVVKPRRDEHVASSWRRWARRARVPDVFALAVFGIRIAAALGAAATPAARVLRWAGDSEGGAPYVFQDPANPSHIDGYEVDVAAALGREMGRRAVFVQNQWDGLVPGLQRGDYDIVLNGLEITADREREIAFTIPYYATAEQLSVRVETNDVASLADLRGKSAGTLKYSLAERVLRGAGGIDVHTYDGQINAYEDLANGRLDAVLMDWPIALYYSRPNPKMKFVGPPIAEIHYGIGVRKSDAALLGQLNDALLQLEHSGELQRIYTRWGLWNEQTARLFEPPESGADRAAPATGAATALDEFTRQATHDFTWPERLRQYAGYLPLLLGRGAPMTLAISILAMVLAVSAGLGLALSSLYGPSLVSGLSRAYVELVRGTPLLIQLYLIFYGLPNIGIKLQP